MAAGKERGLVPHALLVACALLAGWNSGRKFILIADAGNGRIVQADDFSGAAWAAFTYPSVGLVLGVNPTKRRVESLRLVNVLERSEPRSPSALLM